MTAPPPMVDADADLTNFRDMPLEVVRFAKSDLVAFAPAEAVLAALMLWGSSWHSRPAGSLTDDDRSLMRAAGFGRGAEAAWQAVRDDALRGWVKCADGRLYHPVVAEKVRDAWLARLKQRHRTYLAAVRQHNGRNPDDQRDGLSFDDWLEKGRPEGVRRQRVAQQIDLDIDGNGELSREADSNVTRDKPESHANGTPESREKNVQGKGREGKGRESNINNNRPDSRDERSNDEPPQLRREDILDLTQRLTRVASVRFSPDRLGPFNREISIVEAWLKDGIDPEKTIVPAIADRLAKTDEDSIGSLKFFDPDVRKAHARQSNGDATAKAEAEWTPARKREALESNIALYRRMGRNAEADAMQRTLDAAP